MEELVLDDKGVFSDEDVIGIGGNGKVYKGVLAGGVEVAVKRISHENIERTRELLAEISSLRRLKRQNVVGLRGWCKKEKVSLILVYDYMENGSLDKRECCTCMRSGRPSNVLLDKEINGRLGDFGPARMLGHGQATNTTQVVGTVGYLAPDVIRGSQASTQTDMFCFRVMCGRRPIEEGRLVMGIEG
ncbi:hypothetical protein HYC85_018482 [Camellia sinensis]|uniref:Protein kinase domain-containing protein n=1 Tax=Camellia sinensis TaxID=4442 RepID=A0A7J7GW42_CAMSI|nr:hypothetical protein HYC85_018482 [Camellia sinensis]